MNGISALYKETHGALSPFPPCVEMQQEVCSPEEGSYPSILHADLELSAPRSVWKTLLLRISHPVCGLILLQQPSQTKTL